VENLDVDGRLMFKVMANKLEGRVVLIVNGVINGSV